MLSRFHRWLGRLLAAVAAVAFISGGLLLWSDDYQRWRNPAIGPALELAPAPTADGVARALEAAPVPVSTVAMPTATLPAYRLYLRDGTQALHLGDSGPVFAHGGPLDSLPAFLFELHVRLFAGDTGHQAIGVIGLLLLLLLTTGPVLWWPRRRVLRLRRVFPRGGSVPRVINAHAAQGVFIAAPLAMLALTGAMVVFHEPSARLLDTLLGSRGEGRPTVQHVVGAGTDIHWPSTLIAARDAFPDGKVRLATLPRAPGDPLTLRIRNRGEWHPNGRSYLVLHPGTGAVLERIDATQTGRGPAVFNALYPLHAGKTGWPGYRALLFLAALGGGFLAGAGAWVALRRLRTASSGNDTSARRGTPRRQAMSD